MSTPDDIFYLDNGTEISIEAAVGDLRRVEDFLTAYFFGSPRDVDTDYVDGLIADVGNARRLLLALAYGI